MASDFTPTIAVLSILVFLWTLSSATKSHTRKLPYPPGPAPSFIWGNDNELSAPSVWKKYAELANEYGTRVLLFVLTNGHLDLLNLGNILYLRVFKQEDSHPQLVGRCNRVARTAVENIFFSADCTHA